jgi:pyruvate/2-oxoglutarate dehydrogenase complex dihydrolipoamide acyltransferase (E2) component
VKEGDEFQSGDPICEIAFPSLTIQYAPEDSGILADVLVNDGQFIGVDKPFAVFANSKEDYLEYLDTKREAILEASKLDETIATQKEAEIPPAKVTPMIVLRHIKHMIQQGQIDAGSGKINFLYFFLQLF